MHISKAIRLIMAFAALAGAATAHDAPSGWSYPPYCCNGDGHSGDCQPIPAGAVKIVAGGFEVMLAVGDHRLVTKPHSFFVPYQKAQPSPDGMYHLCLFPTEDTVRCFFAPPMGS